MCTIRGTTSPHVCGNNHSWFFQACSLAGGIKVSRISEHNLERGGVLGHRPQTDVLQRKRECEWLQLVKEKDPCSRAPVLLGVAERWARRAKLWEPEIGPGIGMSAELGSDIRSSRGGAVWAGLRTGSLEPVCLGLRAAASLTRLDLGPLTQPLVIQSPQEKNKNSYSWGVFWDELTS